MTDPRSELDLIIDRNALSGSADKRIADLDEPTAKLVVVRLGEVLLAFPGRQIREILPCSEVFLVPGCPDYVQGIINIRGDVDSVLNLRRVLGMADAPVTADSRFVVGLGGGIRSGLRVDSVEDVLDVAESCITPPLLNLPEAVRDYVSGQISLERGVVAVLNLDLLFGKLLS